jgi:hypothetical protein
VLYGNDLQRRSAEDAAKKRTAESNESETSFRGVHLIHGNDGSAAPNRWQIER